MRCKSVLMAGLLATAFPAVTLAQAQAEETDPYAWLDTLETVDITGTRTLRQLSNAPQLTRVIAPEAVRISTGNDVTTLLTDYLPGVEFSQAMNRQTQINLQGFGGGSVLFLIDGERMAGETLDNVDYSRLTLQNIERVEIIRGAAAAVYGSGAAGGVVNIITRRATAPFSADVDALYVPTTGEYRLGASAELVKGRLGNILTAQFNEAPEIKLPSPGDYTTVDATRTVSVSDRLNYSFSDRVNTSLHGGIFYRRRRTAPNHYSHYRDYNVGATVQAADFNFSYGLDIYTKDDYVNRQNTLRGRWDHTLPLGGGNVEITAGAEWMNDFLRSYQFSDAIGAGPGSHDQNTAGVYAQADYMPVEGLSIVPALRYDYYSASGADRLCPKLSVMYTHGRMTWRAGYYASFRAPTLKEMFMDFDMVGIFHIYGNPDLKPEHGNNFTASAEYHHGILTATAGVFHNIIDGRISYLWDDLYKGQRYLNLKRLRLTGIDASAALHFNWGMTATASYVFTREALAPDAINPTPMRPHSLVGALSYTRALKRHDLSLTALLNTRWNSAVDGTMVSVTEGTAVGERHYPAYNITKLTLSALWRNRYTLTLTVDNLFNYRPPYYYFNSPLTTGTTFCVCLSARIP